MRWLTISSDWPNSQIQRTSSDKRWTHRNPDKCLYIIQWADFKKVVQVLLQITTGVRPEQTHYWVGLHHLNFTTAYFEHGYSPSVAGNIHNIQVFVNRLFDKMCILREVTRPGASFNWKQIYIF